MSFWIRSHANFSPFLSIGLERLTKFISLVKSRKYTIQKMKFSIKDFFSNCDQIRRKLRIWSHLLKKSLMENYAFSNSTISLSPRRKECPESKNYGWLSSYKTLLGNEAKSLWCICFLPNKLRLRFRAEKSLQGMELQEKEEKDERHKRKLNWLGRT